MHRHIGRAPCQEWQHCPHRWLADGGKIRGRKMAGTFWRETVDGAPGLSYAGVYYGKHS